MGFFSTLGNIAWTGYKAGAGTIGSAAYWLGKKTAQAAPGAAAATAKGSIVGAGAVGEAALTGIKTGVNMAAGLGDIAGSFIDYNPAKYKNSIFGAELTGTGKALVAGTGLLAGTVGAYRDYETTQMGTPSGEIASPTPHVSYTHFGEQMGATGDLVFAMNRNRRG